MTRGWGLALLALSVGLNLGLAVAVVEQRLRPPPPPVAVTPAPTAVPTPIVRSASPVAPERTPGARETIEPFGEPPSAEEPSGENPVAPMFRGPSPARLEELAARLGVPPEDRPRFVALQREFIAATRERRQQLELVRREMKGELLSASPDAARLRALVDSSSQLQAGLERALVEHVLQARQILHGDAERRYLALLAQLGPRLAGPRPGGAGPGQLGAPRWQERPRRPGGGIGWRRGGGYFAPRGPMTAPAPVPSAAPTPGQSDGRAPAAAAGMVEAIATGLPPG